MRGDVIFILEGVLSVCALGMKGVMVLPRSAIQRDSMWDVPTSLPRGKIYAHKFKRAGKWMWRPERVVLIGDCVGITGGPTVGVSAAGGLILVPWLVSCRM